MDHYLIDKRIELPPHTDLWMSGDRYGRITAVDGKRIAILLDKSSRSVWKRMSYLDDCTFV
jgi:hypothetical protein